jgi:hypothetical protein
MVPSRSDHWARVGGGTAAAVPHENDPAGSARRRPEWPRARARCTACARFQAGRVAPQQVAGVASQARRRSPEARPTSVASPQKPSAPALSPSPPAPHSPNPSRTRPVPNPKGWAHPDAGSSRPYDPNSEPVRTTSARRCFDALPSEELGVHRPPTRSQHRESAADGSCHETDQRVRGHGPHPQDRDRGHGRPGQGRPEPRDEKKPRTRQECGDKRGL